MRALWRVGLAAEHDSPEDPGGSEIRVALAPPAVTELSDGGRDVAVESGAGDRMGFSDDDYRAAGATIVARDALYRDRDLVIKLKGPTHRELRSMDPGSMLVCMAHVKSVPERAAICDERNIDLLALEHVTEPPPYGEAYVRSAFAMREILAAHDRPAGELEIAFAGFEPGVFGALQHAARSKPRSLQMRASPDDPATSGRALVVEPGALKRVGARLADADARRYVEGLAPRRKIESLHLTGRAGARFGIDLLLRTEQRAASDIRATVLGYGNVAFGALDELVRAGVPRTNVLTERTTRSESLRPYLESSDLIVNGIDGRSRNVGYVVTDADLGTAIRPGAIVIDLVGGSASNRGAVEPIVECTAPTDPVVVVEGVHLSSVWGWPLMGFGRESMERYSDQILRMLLVDERVLDGWERPPAGIHGALVAGPLARDLRAAA